MEIVFLPTAMADLDYWKTSGNSAILKKIRQLLEAIQKDSFQGIGKPEALKHSWTGWWSRRINQEHRIIYKVDGNVITVYAVRFHYKE